MDDLRLELKGDKKLRRALKKLPAKVQRKVTRQAVSAGATPITKEMRRRAPVATGATQLSIRRKTKTDKKTGTIFAIIGADTRVRQTTPREHVPARIVHILEKGSIRMAARPFMRPAFEAKQSEAEAKIRAKLGQGIEREAAKLKGGG